LGAWGLLGLGVLGISWRFEYGVSVEEKPIEAMVLLMVGMSLVFLLLARTLFSLKLDRRHLMIALAAGLLLRVAMLFSVPILETDFYRYLWDGAVTAHGMNPYKPVPSLVPIGEPPLRELGEEAGDVLARINHPELRTIYPPVAQGFFAFSHLMSPWSLLAWRSVLLAADILTLVLLLMFLQRCNLPYAFALFYWLNPIVLKEIHNAAHMDILLAPFVLGALLLAHGQRLHLAVLCLVAATGIKVWPVLLLPLVLLACRDSGTRRFSATILYAALVVLIHTPIYLAGLDSSSGFVAYAGRWEMNNGPYLLLLAIGRLVESLVPFGETERFVASGLSLLIVGTVVVVTLRQPLAGLDDLAGRALVVIATLFLISPTQFPWYAIWFLPLLAIRPHAALLFYALTLPLYYMRFRYAADGIAPLFDNWIVWVEHGPILVLLLFSRAYRTGWIPASGEVVRVDNENVQLSSANTAGDAR
jgi:hypothetical protein